MPKQQVLRFAVATADGPRVRPFAIVVPWDEVIDREDRDTDGVLWTPQPREGCAVHFDIVYVPPGMQVTSHPGARSMGTELVGEVRLANGERVFVVTHVAELNATSRSSIARLRSVRVHDENGTLIKTGVMGFGTEPNPDADDGTQVATTEVALSAIRPLWLNRLPGDSGERSPFGSPVLRRLGRPP
jgi:hypothetical protein